MLERVSAIEATLKEIAPLVERLEKEQQQYRGIGHNQPPEPLPIDTAQIQMGISAANVLPIELSEEHPSFDVIRLCGLVLKQVWKGIVGLGRWLATKGNTFLDALLKSAGSTLGKRIIDAAALGVVLNKFNVDMADVIARIEKWLRALGLPL